MYLLDFWRRLAPFLKRKTLTVPNRAIREGSLREGETKEKRKFGEASLFGDK